MVQKHPSLAPTHPGEVLREDVLPGLGISKSEMARRMAISRQHLYAIMDERQGITPVVAAKIGKLVGNGPGIWLRLQATYDTWHAETNIDVSEIETAQPAE